MTQPMHAVAVSGLTKTYPASGKRGPKLALDGVDLSIPRGSLFGLLGPNGAGKSTLINILAGLVLKTSGHAEVWGIDIDQDPRRARGAIGIVPQELNLDPFFTPRQLLDLHGGLYGVPKSERRTAEILEAVGLTPQADSYARAMSGGMLFGNGLRPGLALLQNVTKLAGGGSALPAVGDWVNGTTAGKRWSGYVLSCDERRLSVEIAGAWIVVPTSDLERF